MRFLNLTLSRLVLMSGLVWLCSCSYTKTFTPELKDKQQAIADTINSKYNFEYIVLEGKITSGASGAHTVLTIKFINGKNIPADND